MKNRILCWMIAVAVACLLEGGCGWSHPPSAYRPIHQAAMEGNISAVAAELAKSPDDVNLPEDHGITPLHLAAQNCHSNVVALLLDKGAKINATDDDQATPLHLASQEGCTDVVTLLLAHGAKADRRDSQGRTPLDRAEQWHQDAVVQLLKDHGVTK